MMKMIRNTTTASEKGTAVSRGAEIVVTGLTVHVEGSHREYGREEEEHGRHDSKSESDGVDNRSQHGAEGERVSVARRNQLA